ncbi:alpha-L-fucosidase [Luteolibacter sp. AS25]|uniref:alpha-L-fucosidase n=1 Tax=Luteolibacter sp. AS25 TaxID=3135776 RepID=UPI00398A9B5F
MSSAGAVISSAQDQSTQVDHVVILDASNSEQKGETLSWHFELNRAGDYWVQILTRGELPEEMKEAVVKIGDVQMKGVPVAKFVIGEGDTQERVLEFPKIVKLEGKGLKPISLEAGFPISRVRLVPHYKNSFSSDENLEKWKVMHESPEKTAAMEWFKEAKFGMFIHWGLYSQAGGIWKGTKIDDSPYPGPNVAEWLMSTFRISRAEYAELAKDFNPDKSFAQNIAQLAKSAGMKYIVITSKHHDGFALFDSAVSEFDIVDATPYGADAVKELYEATLEVGLGFGVYYSHGNDWMDGGDGNHANVRAANDKFGVYTHAQGKNLWDPSPNTHEEYFQQKAYPQIAELVKSMPELKLIWFDGDGHITEEQAFQFYKLVYDLNPSVIVSRRVGYEFGDYLDAGDNQIPDAEEELEKYWETCGTTNHSWGFKPYDTTWKSSRELIYYLVDIASKGGNYLLNIGPDGKGHVPEGSSEGLLGMGDWLKVNGEAIYGTNSWKVIRETATGTNPDETKHGSAKAFVEKIGTEDFWFTAKDNKVFVISLAKAGEEVRVKALNSGAGNVAVVRLLGSDRKISWEQNEEALELNFEGIETGLDGFAVEVTMK